MRFPTIPVVIREILAEFCGLTILLFLGFSSFLLFDIYPHNAYLVHNMCANTSGICNTVSYGSGLLTAILIAGHVSGGHFNPGVSVALATLNKFPYKKLLYYIPTQYLSAFCASAAVHLFHLNHISDDLTIRNQLLDSLFVLAPNHQINLFVTVWDSFLSCFIFMVIILAITDHKSTGIPPPLAPLFLVIAFIGIIMAFVVNCGAALNPARDLGPKLYAVIYLGFERVFKHHNFVFWLTQQLALFAGFIAG
ncbi:aquaporin-10-like [Oppia nitens]|uniref:aquaporin-10-like n=1 Tax=Oppia nitens TaxID=1686743 RepID=UPI0023DB10AC|nr:aquaporin-10-like [Oppia nitens]